MRILSNPAGGGLHCEAPRRGRWRARAALAALLPVALWLAAVLPAAAQEMTQARVVVHGHTLTVDVADTPDLQVRGLGGRAHLGPDEGMLFVYDMDGDRVFWMRGMLIPIDMIWFHNSHVVHIEPAVPPPPRGTLPKDLPTYHSGTPANMVLELAAGRASELGLKVGDRVTFHF